ncbi:hypothetical protein [Suttonella ornithocola]|uniref:DUF202 domain-containing protein n=1 Tax=Suttonella ornithocola TaxID=279832 RepID=A0A380MV85_9GAMM|nr:hypothetical protein [Suttonella ornithocola]SUO95611.1 Uncharacterised protein [Suttonella ornithocola]
MDNQTQQDILVINQIQLVLAEKRTILSLLRIGIATLILPLSIISFLIATSKYYEINHVWLLLSIVGCINLALLAIAFYLIFHSIHRLRDYDKMIENIKKVHSTLSNFIKN